jgi:pyrimidine deaminase RibD-like protein
MRASDFEISNYNKLDKILSKLCGMIVKGKQDRPDYYGMVAAAVVDPSNQIVARLNRPGRDGKRIHAEHAAMLDYTDKYGDIPEGSIIITTLSPCNEQMAERDGPSCTELINRSTVKKVYCGYMDPTQDDDTRQFNLMETADKQLRNKCKQFADTFLSKVHETQNVEEQHKKTKVRRAAYGPGYFGGYGYHSDYSNGGGDGGGESIQNEDAMMGKIADSGKIIRILKKAHTVPFSDEKNWLLVDMDPAKGNKGLGIKWIPADTRFEWVRPYRDSIDENFNDDAEEYRAHLIKTLPKMMKLFANIGKGWIPSKEQMLNAVDTAYRVMKHTGDAKQAGKILMDELNALYRMSKGKQDVAENFADGKNPQDKGDAKQHGVNTKGSVSSLRKTAKQGGRKGQLAHWMANMKAGKAKNK